MKASLLRGVGFITLLSIAIHTAPAFASDPAALIQLAANNACVRCDLSGASFAHEKLNSVNLSKANLTNADFYFADLTDATLASADLTGAKMEGANLTGADLRSATLNLGALKLATVCRTIMPDDEISMRDCPDDNPYEDTNPIQP